MGILAALLAVGIWLDINAGYRQISLEELWQIIRGEGVKSLRYTLLNLRLPRVLTSLLVGVGLSVSAVSYRAYPAMKWQNRAYWA